MFVSIMIGYIYIIHVLIFFHYDVPTLTLYETTCFNALASPSVPVVIPLPRHYESRTGKGVCLCIKLSKHLCNLNQKCS